MPGLLISLEARSLLSQKLVLGKGLKSHIVGSPWGRQVRGTLVLLMCALPVSSQLGDLGGHGCQGLLAGLTQGISGMLTARAMTVTGSC